MTGWTHVERVVEVIEMSLKDLVYRIVPTTVVTKNMHTARGKRLNKDSEYLLKEEKVYNMVGKKSQVEYAYSLDLKEDAASNNEAQLHQQKIDKERKGNIFTMNLVDFNLFKLRSTIFLLQFPVTFTLLIMNVWRKLLPEKVASAQGCSRAELEEMDVIKTKMHLLSKSVVKHLKALH